MDFVDMIRPVQGKRYMLVVVDRFSRWVEATPAKHKNADTVAKFLCREIIPRFGIPSRISSDNGREFVDKTVKCILQKLGIKQRLGCVYHPQSQGMVERANGVLKNKLLKICMSTGLNWVDALPVALMVYRGSAHRSLKLTPHEMLTGRPMPSPVYKANAKGPSLDLLTDDMRAFVKQMTNIHKSIYAHVVSIQEKEKSKEEPPPIVEPGDLVYVKMFRRKWNIPRREGPFEVIRATATAVQIKGSPTWYHLNHCVKAPTNSAEGKEDQDAENTRNQEESPSPARPEQGEGEEESVPSPENTENGERVSKSSSSPPTTAAPASSPPLTFNPDAAEFPTIDFRECLDSQTCPDKGRRDEEDKRARLAL